MKPIFDLVKIKKPESNVFDLSHEKKLTANFGELIPILCDPVVPGDKWRVKSELFIRLAPMLAPMMHRVDAYVHYFFVPNRLVWSSWEDFLTGGENGLATPTFPVLHIDNSTKGDFVKGSLADYFGIPPTDGLTVNNHVDISALPFRAYQMIYNEYYRDQNLTSEIAFSKSGTLDSGDLSRLATLRVRAWEKDYFTSALPWTQRGTESTLPIDTTGSHFHPQYTNPSVVGGLSAGDTLKVSAGSDLIGNPSSSNGWIENLDDPQLIDGISATITINDLRRAVRIQEWLEKSALAGSRYIEHILVMFGVRSSDARLQRPEYLGGGKTPIVVSEVLQTSHQVDTSTEETLGTPLGTMTGHGVAVGDTNQFEKFFEEHGYVIGILSVLPKAQYLNQGIAKDWTKFDKYDFYYPVFANLGEQEVKKGELWFDYTDSSGTPSSADLFGYQSRYAEYKFKPGTVHGDFRDDFAHWHLAREMESEPSLNTAFVECRENDFSQLHRVFAVDDANVDKLWIQIYNDVQAIRPMPIFGTPTL